MNKTFIITPVDQCIAYIESCGWKLRTRRLKWYRFDATDPNKTTREVAFTLNQIRDAFNNGW